MRSGTMTPPGRTSPKPARRSWRRPGGGTACRSISGTGTSWSARPARLARPRTFPEGAKRAAQRVLDEDSLYRDARAEIGRFLDATKPHDAFWESLRQDAERRAAVGAAIATIDLPAYRPLGAGRAGAAEDRTGDPGRRGALRLPPRPDAGRPRDRRPGARPARCARRLRPVRGTRCTSLPKPSWTRSGGASRCPATGDAERRSGTSAGSPNGTSWTRRCGTGWRPSWRRRPTARGRGWNSSQLAREMEALAREYEAVCAEAARQDVPRPLLPEWRGWEERARTFVDDATWALRDADLLEGWEGLTDLPARVGEEHERMAERIRLPAHEEARLDRMLEAETARLRDPDTGHEYEHDWWGQEPLAAGDRLKLAAWREGPGREAVVVWPGAEGGCARGDGVALEWAGSEGLGGVGRRPRARGLGRPAGRRGATSGCGKRRWRAGRRRNRPISRTIAETGSPWATACAGSRSPGPASRGRALRPGWAGRWR